MWPLTMAGIALIVFGAVVLLVFPSRPGAKIALHGFEISSVGAGLPLIFLGVLSIISTNGALPAGIGAPDRFGLRTPSLFPPGACTERYFQGLARDRIATIERGRAISISSGRTSRRTIRSGLRGYASSSPMSCSKSKASSMHVVSR